MELMKCKTCEVLKEQLDYERARSKELLETITSLVKPQVIVQNDGPEPRPIPSRFKLMSRHRAEIERADREAAKIRNTSPVVAKPDETLPADGSIAQLEFNLGINEFKDTIKPKEAS